MGLRLALEIAHLVIARPNILIEQPNAPQHRGREGEQRECTCIRYIRYTPNIRYIGEQRECTCSAVAPLKHKTERLHKDVARMGTARMRVVRRRLLCTLLVNNSSITPPCSFSLLHEIITRSSNTHLASHAGRSSAIQFRSHREMRMCRGEPVAHGRYTKW